MSLEYALSALALGLSVVPPREDGSKAPLGCWKDYQSRIATREQLHEMYSSGLSGVGLVTGAVSGNVEMVDFDNMDTYDAFCRRARHCGLSEVVARIEAGYLEASPKPGRHWLWRSEGVGHNQKLARRPATAKELAVNPDDKIKTLVEIKGDGGYGIVAPTNGKVHPNGGRYELLSGSLEQITTVSVLERTDLLDLARSFDVCGPQKARKAPVAPVAGRPGDEWAARTSWEQVMAGWPVVGRGGEMGFLRRPGKNCGISATINFGGSDLLYVFSSSTEFEAERSYTKFGAYTVLNHGGNHRAAARALAAQGWGEQAKLVSPSRQLYGVDTNEGKVRVRYGNEVARGAVRFLWQPRVPLAKLTLLVGDPDQGKSYLALALAAAVTQGWELPDSTSKVLGRVAVLAFEDDPEDTILPRFDAIGGDDTKLAILDYRNGDGSARSLEPGDLPSIHGALRGIEDLRLVIVDPVVNLMTGLNENRGTDVRAVLMPLVDLARDVGAAVIGLIHMNKADMANVLYRVSGSGAFVQVARSLLLAGTHPESGKRFLTHPKHNLSVQADAIEYSIDEGRGFMWGEIDGEVNEAKLLERRQSMAGGTRAERFLRRFLGENGRRASEVVAAAAAEGIPERTLYGQAKRLGVSRERQGFGGEVWWSLPPSRA